jgi:hypothetical protein
MNPAIEADQTLRELALAIARNAVGPNNPLATVLAGEAITQTEYDRIKDNPTFQRYVAGYTKDLTENGFSFAAKSQVLAEELLPVAYALVKDPDVAGPARVKMMENLVEWAGLKPKAQAATIGGGTGFSITINIPSAGIAMQANQNAVTMGRPKDAIDVPVIEVPTAPTPEQAPAVPAATPVPKRTSAIRFDEPEDFEYAGDDVSEC